MKIPLNSLPCKIMFGLMALLVAFLAYTVIAQKQKAPPLVVVAPDDIATSTVVYADQVSGYLALPKGDGKAPAVILIHEWWGLNDDIRRMADAYAEAGYVALAVDMYRGKSTTDPAIARELASAVRGDEASAFAHLRGAVAFVQSLSRVDAEKVASVGWCFGGGWSYQMALNSLGTVASVMYYGQFDPEDDFSHMKSHILGHFGEADTAIKIDDVKEFQARLSTVSGAHEVYIYPNVGHGFANERGGNNLAYSEEAAHTAWLRTLDFLDGIFNPKIPQ